MTPQAFQSHLARTQLMNAPDLRRAHAGNAILELRANAEALETKARRIMAIATATRAAADLAEAELQRDYERRAG